MLVSKTFSETMTSSGKGEVLIANVRSATVAVKQVLAHSANVSLVLVLAAMLVVWGCEKKPTGDPKPIAEPTADTPVPDAPPGEKTALEPGSAGNTAVIKGIVKLNGTVPKLPSYNMAQKPECAALHAAAPAAENIVAGAGGELRDVFVQVSGGLENFKFTAPAEPVTIDQTGCLYKPHVFGIMVGQDIKLVNSDKFLHNVKVNASDGRPINEAMPQPASVTKRKWFKKAKIPTPFQCEVHPWMKAYGCVVDHPYHSTTKADGTFEISGLPAGKYKISAWHSLFPGLKAPAEEEIEVGAGETKEIELVYTLGM
jgi:plastocyanin